MNKEIRKLIDDNWDEIKELIIEKAEAEQKLKPKTIWDLDTVNRVVCCGRQCIMGERFRMKDSGTNQ